MKKVSNETSDVLDLLENDNLDKYYGEHYSWAGRQLKIRQANYLSESKWFVFKPVTILDANQETINDGIKYSLGKGRPKYSAVRLNVDGKGGGVFRDLELVENEEYTFTWYDTLDKHKGQVNKKDSYTVTISGSPEVRESFSAITDVWSERVIRYTPSHSGRHVLLFLGSDSVGSYKRGCVITNISCKSSINPVRYEVRNITEVLELKPLQGNNAWIQSEDWEFGVSLGMNEQVVDGVVCQFELTPNTNLSFSSDEDKYISSVHDGVVIIPAGTILSNSMSGNEKLIVNIYGHQYQFVIKYGSY